MPKGNGTSTVDRFRFVAVPLKSMSRFKPAVTSLAQCFFLSDPMSFRIGG